MGLACMGAHHFFLNLTGTPPPDSDPKPDAPAYDKFHESTAQVLV